MRTFIHPLKHLGKAVAVLAVAVAACLLALAGPPGTAAASDEPPPASEMSDNPSEEAPSQAPDAPSDELPPEEAPSEVSDNPMHVTGFDREVAAAHGYEIRTRPDGTQYAAKRGEVSPSNTVGGRCGYSWLYLDHWVHGYRVRTGFHLFSRAVSFGWAVDVYGPRGKRFLWGGGLPFRYRWDGTAEATRMSPGRYSGLVSTPSFAVLWDGRICTSGHPWDSVLVF